MCKLLNVYALCRNGQKGSEKNVLQLKHRAKGALPAMFWIELLFEGKVVGAKVTQWRNASMRGTGVRVALAPLSSTEASACAVPGHKNHGWSHVPTHTESSFASRHGVKGKLFPFMLYLCCYKCDCFHIKKKAYLAILLLFNHFKVLHTYNLLQKKSFIGLE